LEFHIVEASFPFVRAAIRNATDPADIIILEVILVEVCSVADRSPLALWLSAFWNLEVDIKVLCAALFIAGIISTMISENHIGTIDITLVVNGISHSVLVGLAAACVAFNVNFSRYH
jgi:hypothetical protein